MPSSPPPHWDWTHPKLLREVLGGISFVTFGYYDLRELWKVTYDDDAWRRYRENLSNKFANILVMVSTLKVYIT